MSLQLLLQVHFGEYFTCFFIQFVEMQFFTVLLWMLSLGDLLFSYMVKYYLYADDLQICLLAQG